MAWTDDWDFVAEKQMRPIWNEMPETGMMMSQSSASVQENTPQLSNNANNVEF